MTGTFEPHVSATPRSPYVGLAPYLEDDERRFFGRNRECALLVSNLVASRLTVLYGSGGVGKTSLLLAGVIPALRRRGAERRTAGDPPEFLPVVVRSWLGDPLAAVRASVEQACAALPGTWQPPQDAPLAETIDTLSRSLDGSVVVVLDQLDEFFVYHGAEVDSGFRFVEEFAACVNRPRLRASFLISIREDALGQLDLFTARIPQLFDNWIRVENLTLEAARDAIVSPLVEWGTVSVEEDLVAAVLDQLRSGALVITDTPGIGLDASITAARIEPAYLQIVMSRLWDEAAATGAHVIGLQLLEKLGGAHTIVRSYLDDALDELPDADRDVAASMFRYLVTPSGVTIAHGALDLAEYTWLPVEHVEAVLERLAHVRIVRPIAPPPESHGATRYEIFHSTLAPAVLDWLRRFEGTRGHQLIRVRQRRLVARLLATLLVVVALEGALILYLLASR